MGHLGHILVEPVHLQLLQPLLLLHSSRLTLEASLSYPCILHHSRFTIMNGDLRQGIYQRLEIGNELF